MKKLENFLNGNVLIKEKTGLVKGGGPISTAGFSAPCSRTYSYTGCITYSRDYIENGVRTGVDGVENNMTGTGPGSGGY